MNVLIAPCCYRRTQLIVIRDPLRVGLGLSFPFNSCPKWPQKRNVKNCNPFQLVDFAQEIETRWSINSVSDKTRRRDGKRNVGENIIRVREMHTVQ